MLYNHIVVHRRKWAAILLYAFSMHIFIPCLASPESIFVPALTGSQARRIKWDNHVTSNNDEVRFLPKVSSLQSKAANKKNKKGPGPGQPEQKTFQSVNAQNMVDLFSGDFSYNIPLLDVGGYPVNIHYRSGITMDQEASWVGLGWNIQPGSINRNMRGIPDDFNGDTVTKKEFTKPYWTAGINLGGSAELVGLPLSLGLNAGLFYNSYRGIGFETGESINLTLTASKGAQGSLNSGIGINLNNNSQNGFSIEPSFNLYRQNSEAATTGISNGFLIGAALSTRTGMKDISFCMSGSYSLDNQNWSRGFSLNGSYSFAHQAYTPKMSIPYTSNQFSFSIKLGGAITVLHPLGSIGGYYSTQSIAPADAVLNTPAVGYYYLQNGYSSPAYLLDFNREKELPAYSVNPPTPHLAIPNYTYDIYSISGEGTGGMFRPYRGDIGYVRDPLMRSKNSSDGANVDLGAGYLVHVGVDVRESLSTTTTGGWTNNNNYSAQNKFTNPDSTYENVYFRNPSEKTTNAQSYYDKVGDTKVLLPVMTSSDDPLLTPMMQPYSSLRPVGGALNFNTSVLKKSRDKRTQVISMLTALETSNFGLDKQIQEYPYNTFQPNNCTDIGVIQTESRMSAYRKAHHYSEITVLNGDGKRYIYGLPVYNIDQEEVSMAVDKNLSNISSKGNQVNYTSGTNGINNQNGKDHFYSREIIPAYASSFLITGLLSSDYVDRTGDGITDDDQGDAVKFGYTQLYGASSPYQWRTPFGSKTATYQEGLKTDNSDDKGSYIYGKKEIWYLNSIMTKTMIATFTLNDPAKGEIRNDGYGVLNEDGGLDVAHGLRYLKQIDLYTKADYLNYLKNGSKAHPIKTVHFSYSYRLCPGIPDSRNGSGKLTLDSIWFSYNGNEKGPQNPYVFTYSSTNPSYNSAASDRWGNYKDPANNPGHLSNADFPYTLQDNINGWDSTHAAASVSAWALTAVKLPSSGSIKVDYESDDYAFVQNKRATEMMQLVGFSTTNSLPDTKLYTGTPSNDCGYAFIHVPVAATNKADVLNKYLDGIGKIYFSYQVNMPSDIYGSGYEHVAVYAQYDDYGVSSTDNHMIWVHMVSAETSGSYVSPVAKAAIQALRLNLPSKAFPGSDLNGTYDPVALGKALVGYISNFGELISNFANRTRLKGAAKVVDPSASFVRLDNPAYKKFGGGYRVKRITISDNFDAMTGVMQPSVYGQEYDYSTYQTINGVQTRISSGVASWEPAIGNEENPFRIPIEYDMQVSALAPVNNMYSEYPLGEGYFPAAEVCYSKVRIHTINNTVMSANGYEESEYYTTRDFPTMTEQTPLDTRKFKPSILANLFKINARSYLAQTQGFKVEINDMNGKEKANASYPENDPFNPISYTKYFYKTDNDSAMVKHLSNTVAVVDSSTGHINTNAQIGKDIEMMVDFREENTQTNGVDIEANVDAWDFGPLLFIVPSLIPFPQSETERYRSAATMKLVQRYGILNKVLHYEKGSLISTENLLFDAETGDPVLTRTKNEFDDSVYQFTYPAHWAYSGMEPAYRNINAVFRNVQFTDGRIANSTYSNINQYFESGDEIMVRNARYKTGVTLNTCINESACVSPVWSTGTITRIWAIDAAKIQDNKGLSGMFFVDDWGRFVSTNPSDNSDTIKIIRSGKRNIASTPVGSVQSMVSPMRWSGGNWKIIFDDSTKIVNTSAVRFNDFWKVQDTKISISKNVITKTNANNTITLYPINALSMNWYSPPGDPVGGIGIGINHSPFVESDSWYHHLDDIGENHHYNDGIVQSWLEFNIKDNIPATASILSASLSLYPHNSSHQVAGTTDPGYDIQNHWADAPHLYFLPGGLINTTKIELETSNGILGTDWSTLDGTGNTTAQKNSFNGSTSGNYVSLIRSTTKQNSYAAVDVGPIISQGLSFSRFVLRFMPLNTIKSSPVSHNTGRMCFWSSDTSNGIGMKKYHFNDLSFSGVGPPPVQDFIGLTHNVSPFLKINYNYAPPGSQTVTECDSTYYLTTGTTTNCISPIADTTLNPYKYGVLGNWRTLRSYVYYDIRKEKDATQSTDIRKNGTIAAGYIPYWTFTSGKMASTSDSSKWVWNSESNLFNNRGLELENHNALNVYNAVQYGYNQSLPIAVTQNAHYREQAFEGFEDYQFPNSQSTCESCVVIHHMPVDNTATNITTSQAHTGRYSLFVAASNTVNAYGKITSAADSAAILTMKIDTSNVQTKVMGNTGTGLADTIYQYGAYNYVNDIFGLDAYNYNYGGSSASVPSANNINYNNSFPVGSANNLIKAPQFGTNYKVVWQGYFLGDQDFNGILFNAVSTNSFKMWVNNNLVINLFSNDPSYPNYTSSNTYLTFRKGVLYPIRIEHAVGSNSGETGSATLTWNQPIGSMIPTKYLYPSAAAAQASISTTSVPCYNWVGIKQKNLIYSELNLNGGSSVVVSAWIKDTVFPGDKTSKHGNLQFSFLDGTGTNLGNEGITPVYASGNIIEGWQRIEAVITLPTNAATIQIGMNNNNSDGYNGLVYFDDLRVNPFNGNMKSYVYDDKSIRLMAELDPNNYATFYEYDDDGSLVRVKKETEDGIKTIKETRNSLTK